MVEKKKKKTNRPFGQWQLIFKTESLPPPPPPQRQTHSRKLKAAKWSGFPGYNHLTILLPMGMLTESSPKWHFVICHTYAWLHPAKEQEATWVLFVKGMIWIIVVKNKSAFNEQRTKEIPSHRKESIFLYSIKEIIKKDSPLFDTAISLNCQDTRGKVFGIYGKEGKVSF